MASSCPLYSSASSWERTTRFTSTNTAGRIQNTYQVRTTVSVFSSRRAAWVTGYQHNATRTQPMAQSIRPPAGVSQRESALSGNSSASAMMARPPMLDMAPHTPRKMLMDFQTGSSTRRQNATAAGTRIGRIK